MRYYQDLCNQYNAPPEIESMSVISPLITEQMNSSIIQEPDSNEIKRTLEGMNPDGAPGPDGFSVQFYIFAWAVIQQDLTEAICKFFQGFQLPKSWTATTLILIPKSPEANKIEHLRPISLCNVCHKIIARILGNRLGDILSSIISPEKHS